MSPREKRLLVCLPAIIIIIGYTWVYGRKVTQSVATAREELAKTQQSTGPSTQSAIAMAANDDLSDELLEVEARLAALRKQSGAGVSRPADRTRTLRTLTSIIAGNNMQLNSTSKSAQAPRSQGVQALTRQLAESNLRPAAEFWSIEAKGSYLEMLGVLKAFEEHEDFIVPVDIEMNESDAGDSRQRWSFTVWI